jgi:hypothetical protein
VDAPGVKTEDAPVVSQDPETDMDPVVSDKVFADASFIVTVETAMAAVDPTRLPPPEMMRFAPPVMPFPAVVRMPVIVRVPATSIALASVTVPEIAKL